VGVRASRGSWCGWRQLLRGPRLTVANGKPSTPQEAERADGELSGADGKSASANGAPNGEGGVGEGGASTNIFNAVVVCNGHYSQPRVAHIPGAQLLPPASIPPCLLRAAPVMRLTSPSHLLGLSALKALMQHATSPFGCVHCPPCRH